MRIWIDFANSPHPLLFAPVIGQLRADGHEVLLTARDNAQTVELARERWPEVDVVGTESPQSRTAKAGAILQRIGQLKRWAGGRRPQVALSHNSYAQIVAAALSRIPAVTAMDFEHQPVNHLAFRLARTVLVPEVLPVDGLRRQGARAAKLIRYPGLKEELYIGDFVPDREVLARVGLDSRPRILVVARTPPTRAVYHAADNPLFAEALRTVCSQPGAACVALARYPEQREAIRALELETCVVPEHAVDARSLMYAADAMIGAGGTMTREAALMGIPTWTLFAGRRPAADSWLERQGRMRTLASAEQLSGLQPRAAEPSSPIDLRRRSQTIERSFIEATLAAGSARR